MTCNVMYYQVEAYVLKRSCRYCYSYLGDLVYLLGQDIRLIEVVVAIEVNSSIFIGLENSRLSSVEKPLMYRLIGNGG